MPTTKKGKEENREEAEKILAKMNNMIRGRSFAKASMDERFEQLRVKLYELGWLGLVKQMKLKNREMHVQLKLVALDSQEARDLL